MSKRRRWWLGIALALVAGGVIVWRIFAPGGRMEVQLIFIGYTNTPHLVQWGAFSSVSVAIDLPEALLCATNTGSVPVKLWSAIRLPNISNTTQFAQPNGRGLPTVLKPGGSVTVSVRYPMNSLRWQTEFMYQRHNLADRLYGKAWNTGNRTVQTLMEDLLPLPEDGWAQSGWITNPPPLVAASGFLPWTRAAAPIAEPASWVPYIRDIRHLDERPIWESSDIIDASKPRGRYHITAPPDLGDIDFADLSVTKR